MQSSRSTAAPGVAAGITEAMIETLVAHFYARVRKDDMLGPIFNNAIDDWPEHLRKLTAFWSSVTLMTGKYKGQPMAVHAGLSEITDAHFARWLELFRSSASQLCPEAAAALFIDRANRIAESLKLGIAIHRGESVIPPMRGVAVGSDSSACPHSEPTTE